MKPEIEEYLRQQGWTFAGVSQPDHRRQWARVKDGHVKEVAYEDDLVDLALNIVEQQPVELTEDEALQALRDVLKQYRISRWTAEAAAAHGLKSNAFNQLERDGKLNAEFFLAEAARIMAKTSQLPAGQRSLISWVMDKAVNLAIARREASKAPAAPAEKPKATKVRKSTAANKKPAKSNKNAAKSNKKPQK